MNGSSREFPSSSNCPKKTPTTPHIPLTTLPLPAFPTMSKGGWCQQPRQPKRCQERLETTIPPIWLLHPVTYLLRQVRKVVQNRFAGITRWLVTHVPVTNQLFWSSAVGNCLQNTNVWLYNMMIGTTVNDRFENTNQ